MNKSLKIKEAIKATRLKRSGQKCCVFKFKINQSKLSKKQNEQLRMMFVEGKWLYNDIISRLQDPVFSLKDYNPLVKEVRHYDKDRNESVSQLEYLPGSCKQTIAQQIMSSLKTMKTLRERGFQKHGRLKFIKELKVINLKQYGVTHEIRSSTKMKIQGVSKPVKVAGIQQLKHLKHVDFANAKLLNTASGYYVALTCYLPISKKRQIKNRKISNTDQNIIGIDFGCQTSLTLSNGKKINISFGEGEQLRKLQRRLSKRKTKHSNRRTKLINRIRRKYDHIRNKKTDIANKVIHDLKSYGRIVIQDEQLSKWQKSGHGNAVQHSCLGRIKSKLKELPQITVLDKWIPTTKLCTSCGSRHDMKQSDRTFKCDCGIEADRDVHAAQNMVWIYENLVGRDAAEFTLKEFEASLRKHFDAKHKHADDDLRRCSVFS